MKRPRTITKDVYLGLRLPREDKKRLVKLAERKEVRRDPSDLAWVILCEGMERLEQQLDSGQFGQQAQ